MELKNNFHASAKGLVVVAGREDSRELTFPTHEFVCSAMKFNNVGVDQGKDCLKFMVMFQSGT